MSARKAALFYDEIFLSHETPEWHPENPGRLRAVMSAIEGSKVSNKLIRMSPRKASFDEIEAVHTHGYVESIRRAKTGYLDPDTYMSEHSLEAALYASGAVISAIEAVKKGDIERAFCLVRPPGHHAEADKAMGFCIFNNIAVGARFAQKHGFEKVMVVDFDVHHGNGTQHIFEEDDTVYYFSTHQYPHYPGTGGLMEKGRGKGEGFTYNMPMHSGAGDKEYFSVYHDLLPGIMRGFSPDIVLVSAGYDIHAKDPLSEIKVSNDGIREIARGILSGSDAPFVFALEGGYDPEGLSDSVVITLEELCS